MGSWQKAYPEIACGLKRGFTFYHQQFGQPFTSRPDRSNELLVAASPNDNIADTHWYRPDFDAFLMLEAQSLGVDYSDETILTRADFDQGGATLTGETPGPDVLAPCKVSSSMRPAHADSLIEHWDSPRFLSNSCRTPRLLRALHRCEAHG